MSVTAVPLRPLDKGTVAKLWIGLLIVLLLAIGLAWLGTRSLQLTTTDTGISWRAYQDGEGEPLTAADVAYARTASIAPNGQVRDSGQPEPVTTTDVPAPLRPILLQMRKGGSYQVFVPLSVLLEGQPLPPNAPFKADDVIQFRFQIVEIERGAAAQMQMMQGLGMQPGGMPGAGGPPPTMGPSPHPAGPGAPRP